jgi:selenocysteine-specific elongation factor
MTGINKSLLVRGGLITDTDNFSYFKKHSVLALSLELLENAPVGIRDRRKALMITGTTEVEGEIRLYDAKELKPSQIGVVFFKPDDPVYCHIGDRFILRLPTPMVTLGGGKILDHLLYFPRQKQLNNYEYLKNRVSDNLPNLIISEVEKMIMIRREELLIYSDYSRSELKKATDELVKENKINVFNGLLYNIENLNAIITKLENSIKIYLTDNPHLTTLTLQQLLQISNYENELTENLIKYMSSENILSKEGSNYSLSGRATSLKGPVKKAYDDILLKLSTEKYSPPLLSKFADQGKEYKDAVKYIIDTKQAYKCGSDFIFATDAWIDIVGYITEQINKNGKLIVSDLRDKFNITRKFIIPILEETDRKKITKRDGDFRVAGERFNDEATYN